MAATQQRKGGIIQLQVAGVLYDAKGDFNFNIGRPKRDPVIGADKVHGFTETPQVAFIEGKITDRGNLDLAALADMVDVTVTLGLGNGKSIVWRDAWYAAEGNVSSKEGEIDFRFESAQADEVAA
jgi:hypothetical protein